MITGVHPLTALVRAAGRHAWLMRLAPVIIPADRFLHRMSRGRLTLVGLAGLPSLRLLTTGRKSGLTRTNDLLYTPYGDRHVVIGSGWGRPAHPAWTHNLLAHPELTVRLKTSVPVDLTATAERVDDPTERRRLLTAPNTKYYRNAVSLDVAVAHSPMVRLRFTGDASWLNDALASERPED